ncbi:MAG: hypothetical protein HLX50_09315 [Alteromonadaceae bacterium]|nr:hypothetical protein [Alteromonadaceae bacterium]
MKANYRKSSRLGITLFALVTTSTFGGTQDASSPLAPLAKIHLELQVCSDTALSYQDDEVSAQKYEEAAAELYSRFREVGWTEMEIAAAMVTALDDMEQSGELVSQNGDTMEEFQLRNFSDDRCEDQLITARKLLEGNIPTPSR